jgi:hypothetical protein
VSTEHPFVDPNEGTGGDDRDRGGHAQGVTVAALNEATGRVIVDQTVRARRRSSDDLLM